MTQIWITFGEMFWQEMLATQPIWNRISLQQQHQPFVFSAEHFRTPMTNHSSNFSILIRVASEVQNDNRTLITAPSRPHFQCPNCRRGFFSRNSLTVHTNWYKRREQTLTGVCRYCNQISAAGKPASEFRKHLKSAHPSEYPNPQTGQMLVCPVIGCCTKKIEREQENALQFSYEHWMVGHLEQQHGALKAINKSATCQESIVTGPELQHNQQEHNAVINSNAATACASTSSQYTATDKKQDLPENSDEEFIDVE